MDRIKAAHRILRTPLGRINLAFFLLAWLVGVFYLTFGGLAFKIPASACFLSLGCINTAFLLKHHTPDRLCAFTLLAGLFIGFIADIVLDLHFLAGAAVFALGHVFYLAAYFRMLPASRLDMAIFAGLLLPSLCLILFLPSLDYGGALMQGIVIAYALIICLMSGKALSNFCRRRDILTAVLLLGSFLFFFSDLMLLFAHFSDAGRITNILCVNTYYPGQALLAASLFLGADTL